MAVPYLIHEQNALNYDAIKKSFVKISASVSITRLMGGNPISIMPEQFDMQQIGAKIHASAVW
jgi:hypothetical protein